MALPQEKKLYTFADYLQWNGQGRIEIMDGQIIMMAPPSRIHQKISVELTRQLANFLESKRCEVYTSPFAVRLFEQTDDIPGDVQTVFEPDICVICDKSKLDEHGCKGAPDMIIEILSPSTARHDWLFKMNRYQQAGVKEYWIVSPKEQTVNVYTLEDSLLKCTEVYTPHELAKVKTLEGLSIDLSKVFADN